MRIPAHQTHSTIAQRLLVSDRFTEDLRHIRGAGSTCTVFHTRHWPSPSLSRHHTGIEAHSYLGFCFTFSPFVCPQLDWMTVCVLPKRATRLSLLCNMPLCCDFWLNISISPTICNPGVGTVLVVTARSKVLRRQMLTYPQGSLHSSRE